MHNKSQIIEWASSIGEALFDIGTEDYTEIYIPVIVNWSSLGLQE
ncbi:hypothetical protein [Paenibacillus sp. BIHB 4019]|nr:hypothetical protein [Paenibacillus sp. BIHB 4019]